jgi:hypothetical protein
MPAHRPHHAFLIDPCSGASTLTLRLPGGAEQKSKKDKSKKDEKSADSKDSDDEKEEPMDDAEMRLRAGISVIADPLAGTPTSGNGSAIAFPFVPISCPRSCGIPCADAHRCMVLLWRRQKADEELSEARHQR